MIKISDRAELVITSPDLGLEVKIVQLAQPEQERTLTFGKNSVRVRSGQVEVVLTGANADEYEVVADKITLKRFGREVVEIKRRETKVAEALRDSDFRSRSDRSTLSNPRKTDGTGWHGWSADAPPPAIAPFDSEQAKQHQETWAKYLDVPVEYTNTIGMKFRLVSPGEFLMGSTQTKVDALLTHIDPNQTHWQECVKSETPKHKVILTQPVWHSLGHHPKSSLDSCGRG